MIRLLGKRFEVVCFVKKVKDTSLKIFELQKYVGYFVHQINYEDI